MGEEKRRHTEGQNRTTETHLHKKSLIIDFQGGAGHGKLKSGDAIKVRTPTFPVL